MSGEKYQVSPYNYCDYRCKDCDTKDRCIIYQSDKKTRAEGTFPFETVNEDFHNTLAAYWEPGRFEEDNIADIMLEDAAAEAVGADGDTDTQLPDIHPALKEKIVLHLGNRFQEKAETFINHYRDYHTVPAALKEAFYDLDWYRLLLPVKIHRALESCFMFSMGEDEFSLEDAYYTSLVVYKALWKAECAVETLRKHLIEYQDNLRELERIIIAMKWEFRHEYPIEIFLYLVKRVLAKTEPGHKALP